MCVCARRCRSHSTPKLGPEFSLSYHLFSNESAMDNLGQEHHKGSIEEDCSFLLVMHFLLCTFERLVLTKECLGITELELFFGNGGHTLQFEFLVETMPITPKMGSIVGC